MKKIVEKIKSLFYKYKSQVLYLFFGGLSTLLNIIIFFILNTVISINYQVSNVIAWIVVVIFAYITNKIWVFESKTNSKGELIKETISFLTARIITLVIEFILLYLFIEKFLMLEILAKIIINAIVIVLNYIFSKLFIFNASDNKSNIKKFSFPLIIIIIFISIISVMVYKYDLTANGYTIKLSTVNEDVGGDYSKFLGKASLYVKDLDIIKQDFEIVEDNVKYMYLYFNANYTIPYSQYRDYEVENYYILQVLDNEKNVIIEKNIESKYIYESKYKLDVSSLSKGKYTLSLKCIGDKNKFVLSYKMDCDGEFYINDNINNGQLDIAIYYKKDYKYLVLYSFISIITFLSLVIMFMLFKYKNISLHKKFLILSVPIYLMYLILIPPTYGHDEEFHWNRIFEITEGGLISDVERNTSGYVLPSAVKLGVDWVPNFRYSSIIFEKPLKIDYSKQEFISNNTMAVYSPVQYLPQVIGVTIGKGITNDSFTIFYIGRIFNMISCLLFLYLAIKKIPCFKKLMFLLAFIPIAIEGFTTLSGDGILIAITYYFLSYTLDIIYNKNKMSINDYIVLLILGIFIAFSKLVYIPLICLILLIPRCKFKNNKDMLFKLLSIIIISVAINIFWLNIANDYLELYTLGKSKDQISFILSNPFRYFQIFLYSLENYGMDLILQAFGKYLLWDEIISNQTIIPLSLIIVSSIIIFNENNNKKINNKLSNIVLSIVVLVIIALVFTSIFIQWTAFGTDVIYGVQGRYFLPILPLILILLSNIIKGRFKLKPDILDKIIICTCLFVNYITILQFIISYL